MSIPWHPSRGTPRVPSLTPTITEAQIDIYLARRRFRYLCASGSQPEIEELLHQWVDPASSENFGGCTALAEAARNGHISLLEYLAGRGFPLLESGPKTVPDAALVLAHLRLSKFTYFRGTYYA